MSLRELIQRYIIFALGLAITSLGIAFSTKSCLGTSPISAIPYALSLALPKLTIGNWTIIFSVLLIIIQIFILKKKVKKIELALQIIITFPFGYMIDLCMLMISQLEPQTYIMRLVFVLIGCVVVAFGVFLQVTGGVVMLPGDAFVRSIAMKTGKEFGKIRSISDITMTIIAFAICLLALGELTGVREGTVIAALLVGNIVRVYNKKLSGLRKLLLKGCKYN